MEEFICTEISSYKTENLLTRCFWKWVSSANRQNLWKILNQIIIKQKNKKVTDCKNLENSPENIYDTVKLF